MPEWLADHPRGHRGGLNRPLAGLWAGVCTADKREVGSLVQLYPGPFLTRILSANCALAGGQRIGWMVLLGRASEILRPVEVPRPPDSFALP